MSPPKQFAREHASLSEAEVTNKWAALPQIERSRYKKRRAIGVNGTALKKAAKAAPASDAAIRLAHHLSNSDSPQPAEVKRWLAEFVAENDPQAVATRRAAHLCSELSKVTADMLVSTRELAAKATEGEDVSSTVDSLRALTQRAAAAVIDCGLVVKDR